MSGTKFFFGITCSSLKTIYAAGTEVWNPAAASAGMFDTVDGEKADWSVDQSYWALYIGDDYATTGVDTTPIHDGDSFKLVYTRG